MDGKLFAIVGIDGDGTTADVEIFDLETHKGIQMSQLPSKLSGLCSVTVPDRDLNEDLVGELERI